MNTETPCRLSVHRPRAGLGKPSALSALLAAALLVATALPAGAAVYKVDPHHTSVTFKIHHLLSKVVGEFHKFDGTIELDPEKRDSVKVEGWIDAATIDTDEPDRDKHLRGADFFDVATYPRIEFKADELTDVNADRTKGKLHGTLTMHGVTKPVVLDAEWYGAATDPWGNQKAGFAATATINRKDFGIIWNKALDAGGYLVGDEVEIEINVEGNLQKPASAS